MQNNVNKNVMNGGKEIKFKTPCDHYYKIFRKKDPYAKYQFLSPFELKNTLIKIAQESIKKNGGEFLNAGRGNPNFLSTQPREAFSVLNMVSNELAQDEFPSYHGLGIMPEMKGISQKFYKKLLKYKKHKGYQFLNNALKKMLSITNDKPDDLIHQLVIATLGSFYPDPPRIQLFNEKIVNKFLEDKIFKNKKLKGNIQLFATEGATAAIMYSFNSMQINGILNPGDKIGIMTPIFTPYLEVPHLHRFQLINVCIQASEALGWKVPLSELEKLKDKKMKALFLVNPTNPTAESLSKETVKAIGNIIRKYNKNLLILVDNVYAPFVNEYNSLFNELPHNTMGVYSFSKYYGVTGWRLGVIIMHKKNVIDENILPKVQKNKKLVNKLTKRYKIATLNPLGLTFMQRLVLDSREVAEAHTGGISTPQQVMMSLFCTQELMDKNGEYNREIKKILLKRINNLCTPIKYKYIENKRSSNYYIILDLLEISETLHGKSFRQWVHKHIDPLDVIFMLAKKYKTIVLPGVGFAAPPWSIRISLANLATDDYTKIGKNIAKTMNDLYSSQKTSKKSVTKKN